MITAVKHSKRGFHAIVCLALLGTCSQISARPPRPRVLNGTIETIDRNARILRIRDASGTTSLILVWSERTRFIEGGRFVDANELAKGALVKIWYGTPFIGERYVTKIVWERGTVPPAKRKTHHSLPSSR